MALRRQSLSTGDIARHCQVTPATVVNWVKAGKLKVYTTPGGQYRMELEEFVRFLDTHGLPVPEELQTGRQRRVLVIDSDARVLAHAAEKLPGLLPRVVVETTGEGYDGLMLVGSFRPHVVVLDLMMPGIDGAEVCRRLRTNHDTRNMFVVAVSGLAPDNELARRVKRIGVDAFLSRPLDMTELARQLARLLRLTPPA